MKHSLLDTYRQDISRCVKCGACGAVCPSFHWEREESHSARGRMALIQAVLDNRLSVSPLFKDRLATCVSCLACEASCASGVRVTEIIQAAKEAAIAETGPGIFQAVLAGVVKRPTVFRALARFATTALHYPKGQGARVKGHGGKKKGHGAKGRVAFFPGCATNYLQRDLGASVVSVLEKLGFDAFVPEGLKCCGRPVLSLGDRRSATELAARNAKALAGIDAVAVVTACASCGLTFKREYPKLLPPGVKNPPVLDIHEFLLDALAGSDLKSVRKTVTYHDPCHLGRGQGLSQAARNVLRAIPGLTLVEMENPDRCCGFGGVMRITHRELSDGIAGHKVKDILRTGASSVVTGCPGCRMQIGNALAQADSDVDAKHTVQLLEEALEI